MESSVGIRYGKIEIYFIFFLNISNFNLFRIFVDCDCRFLVTGDKQKPFALVTRYRVGDFSAVFRGHFRIKTRKRSGRKCRNYYKKYEKTKDGNFMKTEFCFFQTFLFPAFRVNRNYVFYSFSYSKKQPLRCFLLSIRGDWQNQSVSRAVYSDDFDFRSSR